MGSYRAKSHDAAIRRITWPDSAKLDGRIRTPTAGIVVNAQIPAPVERRLLQTVMPDWTNLWR